MCVRNRSSDFSCFWKCYILSFFQFHLGSWRPLRLQAQRKGCAFVSCQWKRLPALPAWLMPHRLNTQTDKITWQTDKLYVWEMYNLNTCMQIFIAVLLCVIRNECASPKKKTTHVVRVRNFKKCCSSSLLSAQKRYCRCFQSCVLVLRKPFDSCALSCFLLWGI